MLDGAVYPLSLKIHNGNHKAKVSKITTLSNLASSSCQKVDDRWNRQAFGVSYRISGEGKDYPLQYSGLENSMDDLVHRLAKNQTRLSNFHFRFS